MTNSPLPLTTSQRLLSLDILRGITMALMIIVHNLQPGKWGFLTLTAWNGLSLADLVFPSFVFVMGVSIAFAFESRLARGATRIELSLHTLRRAGILFFLGILLSASTLHFEHMRFYGVLQRLAICYLAVGLFYLWDRHLWSKIAALVVILVGYWALLRWVPVPGAGLPGRDVPFLDLHQNLVAWLDRLLMPHHLYLEPPSYNLFDPEGLLSNIPAVGTALLGLLAGFWLRSRRTLSAKVRGLAAATTACLAVGYLWSKWFPLNKHLWTSSFALAAAGWSLLGLTLVYWAVEQKKWGKDWGKGWVQPWLVFGSNSIVAYMFAEFLGKASGRFSFSSAGQRTSASEWLFANVFSKLLSNPGWASFAYSVSFLAVCFVPVWFLYRKKVFVKI
jgi:predicted acyltransferase